MRIRPRQAVSDPSDLPQLKAGEPRRCPYCGSGKWVHLESGKQVQRRGLISGEMELVEIPARYGCAQCGGEFLVEGALAWKPVSDPKKCPHCSSKQVLVAIKLDHGAVMACKHCGRLGLFEESGFKGTVTVEAVTTVGKLTAEAHEYYGKLGFQFEVGRAKARLAALNQGQAGRAKTAAGPGQMISRPRHNMGQT